MKIITEQQVESLGITPAQCVEWVENSFLSKPRADMPAKISVHPFEDSFYTAMPCYHPDVGRVGVKVISRVPGSIPALKSKMMLFDTKSGDMLALIDTNWITSMRTGAVAALAAKTFVNDFAHASFGMVGLGAIGQATLRCLLAIHPSIPEIWLLRYKDHAERIQEMFPQVQFNIAESRQELIANTNLLYSCVTVMHDQFAPESSYPAGYTLVPVHVRGFQNCDTTFDRVIGDDTMHLKGWENFSGFRNFTEFADVLLGNTPARLSVSERLLIYNYGLSLHDLWFAARIYDTLGADL